MFVEEHFDGVLDGREVLAADSVAEFLPGIRERREERCREEERERGDDAELEARRVSRE